MNKPLLAVSYGMGTNSTALLCGFHERGIVPDVILAADTDAERPSAYRTLGEMERKVFSWWGLHIQVVYAKRKGAKYTLEQHCLKTKMLPSLAYGRRSCSQKFKHQPMETWLKCHCRKNKIERITKVIGYAADEAQRIAGKPTEKKLLKNLTETYWYPLAEWGWRREECMDAICRNGLTQPGKSACFFCPASKPSEVFNLNVDNPELIQRALAIEDSAQPSHRKLIGLGGDGNRWRDWLANDESQGKLLDIEPMHLPCHCLD